VLGRLEIVIVWIPTGVKLTLRPRSPTAAAAVCHAVLTTAHRPVPRGRVVLRVRVRGRVRERFVSGLRIGKIATAIREVMVVNAVFLRRRVAGHVRQPVRIPTQRLRVRRSHLRVLWELAMQVMQTATQVLRTDVRSTSTPTLPTAAHAVEVVRWKREPTTTRILVERRFVVPKMTRA
jgi:hypothetical protein